MSPEQNNGNVFNNQLENNNSSFNGPQNPYGQLATSDEYKDGFQSLAAAFEDAGSILDPNRAPSATTPPTDFQVEQKTFIDRPPEIPPKPVFEGYNAPSVFQSFSPADVEQNYNATPGMQNVQDFNNVTASFQPLPTEQNFSVVPEPQPIIQNFNSEQVNFQTGYAEQGFSSVPETGPNIQEFNNGQIDFQSMTAQQGFNAYPDSQQFNNELQPAPMEQDLSVGPVEQDFSNTMTQDVQPQQETPVMEQPTGATAGVDYFNHDFASDGTIPAANGLLRATAGSEPDSFDIPVAASMPVMDNLFSYEANIHGTEEEMAKLLMPSNNLVPPPPPIEPLPSMEAKPVIKVDEEGGADFRAKKTLIKLTLFSFYVMIIGCAAYFGYMWYDINSSFTLGREEITLANGSSYQVEVILKSRFEDNSKYTWKSADDSIATVDNEGIVTAVGSGETKITIKSKKTGKTQQLSVKALSIIVDSIRFEKSKINMNVGDEIALSPIINNDESIIIDLLWDTSNPNVAVVDDYGRVIAVGAGTTTIIAIEETSNLAAEIQIVVTAKKETSNTNTNPKPQNVPVTGILLNRNTASIKVGETISVGATVQPANATNKAVTWSSNNTSVATVSNGRITGVAEGTAIITVTTKDGNKKASVNVTVSKSGTTVVPVTGVSITNCPGSLEIGKNATLNYAITPENATNKNVAWTSDDNSIVSVNNGVVTAHKEGTATITVTTADGGRTARCEIRVSSTYIPATSVSLSETSLTLTLGKTFKLVATVKPDNATEKNLVWRSNDTAVVAVDDSGNLTAIGVGSTTVRVTVNNNSSLRATCTVTVVEDS